MADCQTDKPQPLGSAEGLKLSMSLSIVLWRCQRWSGSTVLERSGLCQGGCLAVHLCFFKALQIQLFPLGLLLLNFLLFFQYC